MESRQKAVHASVLIRPESIQHFHAYAAMMKGWRQGLTLEHFWAQLERFFRDRGFA